MNAEALCAQQIAFLEGERFVCVAERKDGGKFPDLVSQTPEGAYRLREVKYKLEARLVRKALAQLEAGFDEYPGIDRLELVIPLQGRKLKEPEKAFLGAPICERRHELILEGIPCRVRGQSVSVLIL